MDIQLQPDAKGLYHPSSEEQLIALVNLARTSARQLRVRGSGHSVAAAIYTDPLDPSDYTINKQDPPPLDTVNINVALDQYRGLRWLDETQGSVVADAGIYLGVNSMDPSSNEDNSLLGQLYAKGWAFADLGGITEQTISGFLSMGSSGGSLTYSVYDNVVGLRLIDGLGQAYDVFRDKDAEGFNATVTAMGLLGVVSKVYLQAIPTFNIQGQEAITLLNQAEMDVFGDGTPSRPSLEQFLRQVEYTRLEWWPQKEGQRLVTWKAKRIAPYSGFTPKPYEEFTDHPQVAELGISLFYTLIGNLGDPKKIISKLRVTFQTVDTDVAESLKQVLSGLGAFGVMLADLVGKVAADDVEGITTLLSKRLTVDVIKIELPNILQRVINLFVPLDSTKEGPNKGQPQTFQDVGWKGLPMDNAASDVLVPTEFTELWLPLPYTQKVMVLLRDFFASEPKPLERTGTYAFEFYAAKPNLYWMSMSFSDGEDAWKYGAFRVDAYWFVENAGNPAEVFYPQFWKLLRDAGIPFRLHWGKFQPMLSGGDPDNWVQFFRAQYKHWDDFLARRQQKDPQGIFFSDYWRQRFGHDVTKGIS